MQVTPPAKNVLLKKSLLPRTKPTVRVRNVTDPRPRTGVLQKTDADISAFLAVCTNYGKENQSKVKKRIKMYLPGLSFATYFMERKRERERREGGRKKGLI